MSEAVFDERDDARAAWEALQDRGVHAVLLRERFAGEDDDEDIAWRVVVPEQHDDDLVAVAELHGGWLPGEEPAPAVVPPELPGVPRRLKRP